MVWTILPSHHHARRNAALQSKVIPLLTYGRFFHYQGDMSTSQIKTMIDEWPTRRAFSDAVGANIALVHKWADAGRIPARWQASVVAAAQSRGLDYVTAEWMLDAHAVPQDAAE